MRDIAIIGAGVAGMTTALCLLERGHRVTLYERGSPGTGIGGGQAMSLEEHAEPEEAFRHFAQERQPAAARITEQARRLAASIFSTDPADCRSRDARERAAAGAQPAGGPAGERRRQ